MSQREITLRLYENGEVPFLMSSQKKMSNELFLVTSWNGSILGSVALLLSAGASYVPQSSPQPVKRILLFS